MNRKGIEAQGRILGCLCEGMGINATSRITGVAKNTILKLLSDVGEACLEYQQRTLVDLPSKRIQADEIWSFCYSKQKNVPADRNEFGVGDVWVWVAIDADTKLVPSWLASDRSTAAALDFMHDLASRMRGRIQLTTDGLPQYLPAVEEAFGYNVDYAQLVKTYGPPEGTTQAERKYSPGEVNGTQKLHISGRPNPKHVNTSYVERQNLGMRMHMRRFTRLTNAHSKKIENHVHALSLYYMFYNFGRAHSALGKGVSPAMAAGVAGHVWSFEEIAALARPHKSEAPN
jgi:IS1 family transposase